MSPDIEAEFWRELAEIKVEKKNPTPL